MTSTAAEPQSIADPVATLDRALRAAMAQVSGQAPQDVDPVIKPSQRAEFGDFQANGVMGLAKVVGSKPRDLAARVVEVADIAAVAEPLEVAGPGFINIRLRASALCDALAAMDSPSLGVRPDTRPGNVVVDLCGVNVAKQMHVGHLRATIIGDALARVFERLGRRVHRENHLGDWGLPIAMVLSHLRSEGVNLDAITLPELDRAYRAAQLAAKGDESGLATARKWNAGPHRIIELEVQRDSAAAAVENAKQTLVRLQQGEPELERDWRKLIDCTLRALYEALEILNVRIGPENNRGESFYRDRLPGVIEAFEKAGKAERSEGATIVRFAGRERPLLIRKSDGGFLYATTDLAAVRFRTHELGGSVVIYVVDARQRDHFSDVFDAARLIGWDRTPSGEPARLIHIGFGSVLGPDRKPLKTRSGENVTLRSLLDEAVDRACEQVFIRAQDEKAPTHGLSESELRGIGRAVGIAAIKYADLSNDLVRDYLFDMDRMIAFEGNTGPYLQYAHARICSIFAKGGASSEEIGKAPFAITEPQEKALALVLLRYGATLHDVADSLEPHRLCGYLFELANAYSAFYQVCPVLKADPAVRAARLRLCDLTRRVLADGLSLLGIEAPRGM